MSKGLAVLFILSLTPAIAQAQPASASRSSHRVAWTMVGAGAGFGLGLYVGLNAFDDAVNSDRKLWTTALVSAAAGGTIAWLLARPHTPPRPRPVVRLTDAETHELASRLRLRASP